jgi:hypothetical protein
MLEQTPHGNKMPNIDNILSQTPINKLSALVHLIINHNEQQQTPFVMERYNEHYVSQVFENETLAQKTSEKLNVFFEFIGTTDRALLAASNNASEACRISFQTSDPHNSVFHRGAISVDPEVRTKAKAAFNHDQEKTKAFLLLITSPSQLSREELLALVGIKPSRLIDAFPSLVSDFHELFEHDLLTRENVIILLRSYIVQPVNPNDTSLSIKALASIGELKQHTFNMLTDAFKERDNNPWGSLFSELQAEGLLNHDLFRLLNRLPKAAYSAPNFIDTLRFIKNCSSRIQGLWVTFIEYNLGNSWFLSQQALSLVWQPLIDNDLFDEQLWKNLSSANDITSAIHTVEQKINTLVQQSSPASSSNSIQGSSILSSTTNSILKLEAHYGASIRHDDKSITQNLLTPVLSEITTWLEEGPKLEAIVAGNTVPNLDRKIKAARNFWFTLRNNSVGAQTNIIELVALIWVAIHDASSRQDTLENAQAVLLEALYEIQRGYNLSSEGVDLFPEQEDIPLCQNDVLNKLIGKMMDIHPDCQYITKARATRKLMLCVINELDAYLKQSSEPHLMTLIKGIQDPQRGIDTVWDKIREPIAIRMFNELKTLFDSRNEQFEQFIDFGKCVDLNDLDPYWAQLLQQLTLESHDDSECIAPAPTAGIAASIPLTASTVSSQATLTKHKSFASSSFIQPSNHSHVEASLIKRNVTFFAPKQPASASMPRLTNNLNSTLNYLTQAISTYLKLITMGQYSPEQPEVNWSAQDISNYINDSFKTILKNTGLELYIPVEAAESTVADIAHISAALELFTCCSLTHHDNKLKALKEAGITSFVAAGMPLPCLIYSKEILASADFDNISKISLLREITTYLTKDITKFGAFSIQALSSLIIQMGSLIPTLTEKSQRNAVKIQKKYMDIKEQFALLAEKPIDQVIKEIWSQLEDSTTSRLQPYV